VATWRVFLRRVDDMQMLSVLLVNREFWNW
jgi:hypothetical protein